MNEVREMEYIKDRLNQQIRDLQRENSMLRESMYRKDKRMTEVELTLQEADSVNKFLSVSLIAFGIIIIGITLWAIQVIKGVQP